MTGIGQGAAAWIAVTWLDRSCFHRSASGSFSMRTNMLGTHWLWVTRWRSISARLSRASKRSMTTLVAPRAIEAML